MGDKIINKEAGTTTVEHEAGGEDFDLGTNIVVMLLAKGKQPAEVMAGLAMALAVFNTIAAPDEEMRDKNTAQTETFIRRAQADMWAGRDKIEGLLQHRVSKVLPVVEMLEAAKSFRRPPAPEPTEKEHEPETAAFKR